jgi:hypothetical protein
MIIKILKGRSFGGLLDYLFEPQDKLLPEIEARGSPKNQGVDEEPLLAKENNLETDRAGSSKERWPDNSAEGNQRELSDEIGNTKRTQRGELLITNMAGRSKEELREHFEALAALRPDVEVNVLHCILSMPGDDVLSRTTKVRLVMRFVELKGLDRTMFAAVEHEEEGHKHTEIHVISSTIDFKGRLPSDSFDYDKGEAIARQLEKEFGLMPNRSSREAMSRAPTQGEWKQHERTGHLSRPLRLQALVNSALSQEVTLTEFQQRLERRGVALHLLVDEQGKATGSVYEFEGKHVRGRRLGRGFTWSGLQQDWPEQQERKGRMDYEPERDYEAFSRAGSGAVGRGRDGDASCAKQSVGPINGDGAANERTGREAGAHRESDHQAPAISEEGRAAVRNDRARGKGTARRGSGASQEHRGEPRTMHGAGDDNSRRDQGRVPTSATNSPSVLRRDYEDKRQERGDGRALPENGGDEQRSLSERQRGRAGNIGENTGAPQGSRRNASQGDRGTGLSLQDDLQAIEQVDHHRDDSDSPIRFSGRHHGRRNVVLHKGPRSPGDKTLEFKEAADSKEPGSIYLKTPITYLSNDGGTKSQQRSAVDQVIETLWSGSPPSECIADQSTRIQTRKGDAKEIDDHPKQPDVATHKIAEREESLSERPTSLEMVKDRAGSLQEQVSSQGRPDNHKEHSKEGGLELSR